MAEAAPRRIVDAAHDADIHPLPDQAADEIRGNRGCARVAMRQIHPIARPEGARRPRRRMFKVLRGSHDEFLTAKHRKCRHVFRPEELALVVAHDEQEVGPCNPDGLGEPVERLLGALYERRERRWIGFRRVGFAALRGEGVIRHQAAVERVERAISPIVLRAQRPVPRPEDEERTVRRADAEDDLRHATCRCRRGRFARRGISLHPWCRVPVPRPSLSDAGTGAARSAQGCWRDRSALGTRARRAAP